MEDLMVRKSIFKQKQLFETYYKAYRENGQPYTWLSSKTSKREDDYKYECNLAMPLLKQEELFYIEEDDKTVQINQVIRTSKDNVLYICCANAVRDEEQYATLNKELKEEVKQWEEQEALKKEKENTLEEKVLVVTEPAVSEVTGFRKFVKNLFKL